VCFRPPVLARIMASLGNSVFLVGPACAMRYNRRTSHFPYQKDPTLSTTNLRFPDGFVWGAATSSYQIEGGWDADGKGESIWDRFCRHPGRIANGENGEIACDHYHRWKEDVGLMRRLGLHAYRFSISWPRVLPAGRGPTSAQGLGFYDRLVDELHAAGIQPFATLYHWDLPQALHESGGWPARDTCQAFADYAGLVASRLADRVRFWITINEPRVVMCEGYTAGTHAPGVQNPAVALQVAHHLLVAHGLAVQALRAVDPALQVGIALNQSGVEAATDAPEDLDAAERAWKMHEAPFLDALFSGVIPPDPWKSLTETPAMVQPADPGLIAQPLDFVGLNFYSRHRVRAAGPVEPDPNIEYTDMGWEVHAPSLRRVLNRMHRDYRLPPAYVTENGAAFPDQISEDGTIHDDRRQAYLRAHLTQLHHAWQDGVDVRGYFVWSLLDNFEWTRGYSKRFGIIHVDHQTQERRIKQSGEWYARLIRTNAVSEV
jgi:beta-glucosidase